MRIFWNFLKNRTIARTTLCESALCEDYLYMFLGFTFMVPNLVSKENSAACTYNLWTDYTSDSFYLIVRGCRLLQPDGLRRVHRCKLWHWYIVSCMNQPLCTCKLKMCIYVHTRNLFLIIKVILLQKAPANGVWYIILFLFRGIFRG